jgi:hypothetical protein
LKTVSVVLDVAPTGTSLILTMEVDGTLTAKTITVNAGATTATADLGNYTLTAGSFVRWKATTAPAALEDCPIGVFASMNLNT